MKAGKFLESLQAYVTPREPVSTSRRRYWEAEQAGDRHTGGIFHGITALLLCRDQRRREVYR